MLSAFRAQPVVEFKARDKSKIEAVLAYGDRLLVGLNSGHLRVYRFNESQDEKNGSNGQNQGNAPVKIRMVDLLREEEKFSRKPVQQLAIIKEASILIALSDGYVSFYDVQTYAFSERLDRTKGATLFAVVSNIVKDPASGIPSIVSRLAVGVKRKIIIWTWRDMELAGPAEEMSLVHSVKSLTWASGTKIVAGLDPGFVVVDVETQSVSDVTRSAPGGDIVRFGAVNSSGMGYMGMGSWVPKPMATRLSEGQLLLAKDVNTLFIDSDGKAIEKRQIPWAAGPEAIGYSYPYMLALQSPSRGGLEIRSPDTLTLLQTISVPNATILHVPQPYISLAHAGKGFLVASDRCIWRMGALGYNSQIDDLMSLSRFDEAISLVNMLEDTLLLDKYARLREIKIQKAHWLFGQQKYRDALDLFSAAQAPPVRVVALYPASIAGPLSSRNHEGEGASEANTSGQESRATDVSQDDTIKSKSTSKSVDSKGKRSLSPLAPIVDDGVENVTKQTVAENPLEGKDLTLAVHELRAFLAQTRVQLQKYINYDGSLKPGSHSKTVAFEHLFLVPVTDQADCQRKLMETATLVDTTLFRAYMLVSPSLAGSLFRLDNFCSPYVVEEKLYETGRYNDLIDFLHGKKLHRDALEMLQKFGKGDAQDNAQEGFRGPEKTVRYLQQLPFEMIDLILQHAEWPMKENPDLGMEIFLADTENAETLPRDRVLQFLQNIDSKLALKYLEHIVEELHDESGPFHNRLVELYLENLKAAGNDESTQAGWQARLEKFLRDSEQYNYYRALRDLPTNDPIFYESRAIVLSKLNRHKQALEIFVYQMEDYQKAEEYCNRIYLTISSSTTSVLDPDNPDQPESIYTTLLSLYLHPSGGNHSNLEAALELVSRHGSRLPAFNTLSILPTSLPVKELESYFQGRMRAANSIAREEAIVAALCAVEKSDWEAALLLGDDSNGLVVKKTPGGGGRNRRIVIGENRLCGVCNKRFGRAHVRVWPDGEVVHYGCVERRQS